MTVGSKLTLPEDPMTIVSRAATPSPWLEAVSAGLTVALTACSSSPSLGLQADAASPGEDAESTYDGAASGEAGRFDGASDAGGPSTGADGESGEPDSTVGSDGASEGGSPDAGGEDAGPPAIRYIGRFDMSDPTNPTAEWSASAMEARFAGTSVSARLGGNGNYFEIVLDGVVQSTPVLATGASSYSLATGLDAGTHDILVFRRDEAFDQPTQFGGFDFGNAGRLLPPPASPPRRIEVIGDSISAGYGDECTNASGSFMAATENEYIAYGPLTARALGADIHVVAWSGKGMYRNIDGTTTETMPILWQRTIPTDTTSTWDPKTWIPDAVVINLGTNDFNAAYRDPSAQYQATYLQFVTTLRGVYPDAYIFNCVGPMIGGTEYMTVKTAITNVISMRAAAGDTRLKLVEFMTQDCRGDGSGCGCASHPNAAEHQAMATILETAMRTALGW
jgi:lysophospholipase L1-like esterase